MIMSKKRKFDQFPDPEESQNEADNQLINQKISYELIFKTAQPTTLLRIYIQFFFKTTTRLEDLTPLEVDQIMKSHLDTLNEKAKELFILIALCVTVIHNHNNTLDYIKLMNPKLLKLPCAIAAEYGSDYLTLLLSLVDPSNLNDAVLTCVSAAVGSCREHLVSDILSFVSSQPLPSSIINNHILIGACRSNRIQQIRGCMTEEFISSNDYDLAAMAAISSSNSDLYLALLYFGAKKFSQHLNLANSLNCPFKSQIAQIAKIDEILKSLYKTTSNAISIRLLNCAQMSTSSTGCEFFSKEKSDYLISIALQEADPYTDMAINTMAQISFRPFALSVGLIDVGENDKLSCDNDRLL